MIQLERYKGNPILSPLPDNPWENLVVTNPGAWYDEDAKEVVLLYRCAGHDPQHRIYLGLAKSKDGLNFQRVQAEPVFKPSVDGFDGGCIEDPRIIKIDEYYYITYASRPFPPGEYWIPDEQRTYHLPVCPPDFPQHLRGNDTATGLALTKDFKTFIRAGRLTRTDVDDRDVILFPEKVNGKYVMLHRPMNWVGKEYGTDDPAMWISYGDDLLGFKDSHLLATAKFDWERKIGGSTPPIKTPYGWLTLYHAVGDDKLYRVGAMLLDLNDPAKILHRSPHWLLQPEEDYETKGYYNGVVFPCGNVVINDTLFVYYGGADKYACVATCSFSALINDLRQFPA